MAIFSLFYLSYCAALPPNKNLKELLEDIPSLNEALAEDPSLLNNTRLSNIDLKGLVLKNAELKNLRWRDVRLSDSQFINVTISHSTFFGLFSTDNEFDNVTFRKVLFTTDKTRAWDASQDHGTNSGFFGGYMQKVKFEDSTLKATGIAEMQPSSISFVNSHQVYDPSLKGAYNASSQGSISTMQLSLSLRDSSLSHGPFNLKYPSRVVLKNSSIKKGGVDGELESLEIYNSEFAGKAGDKSHLVWVEDSKINMAIPNAELVYLEKNTAIEEGEYPDTISISVEKAGTLLIDDCQVPISLALKQAKKVLIRGCNVKDIWLKQSNIGSIDFCGINWRSIKPSSGLDAITWPRYWKNAQIREWNIYQSQITGELPPADSLRIGTLSQDSESQVPEALQQRADKRQPLKACPPWPNALERQKLESKARHYQGTPKLSESLFPDESSDDSPKPFDRVVINENQLGFVYNPGWIEANQPHYSLSPDLVPPPIAAVTLVSMDDHAEPIHDANNNPLLFLGPYYPETFITETHGQLFKDSEPRRNWQQKYYYRLLLWFAKSEGFPEYLNDPMQLVIKSASPYSRFAELSETGFYHLEPVWTQMRVTPHNINPESWPDLNPPQPQQAPNPQLTQNPTEDPTPHPAPKASSKTADLRETPPVEESSPEPQLAKTPRYLDLLTPDYNVDVELPPFSQLYLGEDRIAIQYNPEWLKAFHSVFQKNPSDSLAPPPVAAITVVSLSADKILPEYDQDQRPLHLAGPYYSDQFYPKDNVQVYAAKDPSQVLKSQRYQRLMLWFAGTEDRPAYDNPPVQVLVKGKGHCLVPQREANGYFLLEPVWVYIPEHQLKPEHWPLLEPDPTLSPA